MTHSPSEIFTIEDLLRLKEYARIAAQMPTYREDVIQCLGYEDSAIESLSPESFLSLFQSINNNGRDWIVNVETSFKERLNVMVNLHNTYRGGLEQALNSLDEMIQNGEIGDMNPICQAIRQFWSELIYETAKNDTTCQRLNLFTDILVQTNSISQQSDLPQLYVSLTTILNMLEESYTETQSILDCFINTDHYYENEYPEKIAPLGNYITDSKDIRVVLKAECQTASGGWQSSELELSNFDPLMNLIKNDNGNLIIQDEADWSSPYDGYCYYPAGSYRKSSRDIEILLTAQCKTSSDSYQTSHFSLTDEFIIKLKNNNGSLSKET